MRRDAGALLRVEWQEGLVEVGDIVCAVRERYLLKLDEGNAPDLRALCTLTTSGDEDGPAIGLLVLVGFANQLAMMPAEALTACVR